MPDQTHLKDPLLHPDGIGSTTERACRKQEAMGDLKQMAQGSLDTLKGKAMGAMEQGQEAVEREWNDFISGQDSN